ncbi:putative mitochondrial protein [Tanacetum coccineum]
MLFSGVPKLKRHLRNCFRIGAVPQQNKHPIGYLSKTLAPKHQSLSTYEKALLAMVLALQKWRGYLIDRHFKIRTDHFSLKYVLDPKITTPFQSRQGVLFSLLAVSTSNELMDAVIATWSTDHVLKAILEVLKIETNPNNKYMWHNDQLRRKNKWVVGQDEALRKKLIDHFQSSVIKGHSGVQATTKRLTTFFYWKGSWKMVK